MKSTALANDLNMAISDIISTYVYRIGLSGMQYSYSTAIGIFPVSGISDIIAGCKQNSG